MSEKVFSRSKSKNSQVRFSSKSSLLSDENADARIEYGSLVDSKIDSEADFVPEIRYRKLSMAPSDPATLSWKNLTVYLPAKKSKFGKKKNYNVDPKMILKQVSGQVEPGQLVALMGASGAGKTTLLNTLVGRNMGKLEIEGSIEVNGRPVKCAPTSLAAYVQQDDLFIGTLTVREHLMFQALLRLPKKYNREQKMARVDEVIHELGLTNCRNTKIGIEGEKRGISGGEAKRLQFAAEILTNPPILFCDEPTTGLDSYLAEQVVKVLQSLAAKGKTILCTIHQPASQIYALFNQIILLSEGRTAYFGNAQGALEFFDHCGYQCPTDFNPADFFVQTLAIVPGKEQESTERVEKICDEFEASDQWKKSLAHFEATSETGESLKTISPYQANWLFQVFLLTYRSILNNFRDKRIIAIKLVQKIVLGIFVGLLYFKTPMNQEAVMNINGALFFALNEVTFPAIFGVVNAFPMEFPVFVREHYDGMYWISSYYVSKVAAYIPTFTFDGMLYVSIIYFMIGLQNSAIVFFRCMGLLILIEQFACSFGALVSAMSPGLPVALTIIGPVVALLSMVAGIFANISTIPVYLAWLRFLSWFFYGFESLAINQWHGIENITCDTTGPCLKTGDEVLASYSFSADNLLRDCLGMLACTLGFHLIAYFSLWFRTTRAK